MKKSVLVLAAVAAVSALLLSAAGPALAAGHGHKATASTAKKHKKPKRGPRGTQGPAGPAGQAGPAGKNGADGKDGVNGRDGKEGKEGKEGLPGGFVSATTLDISSNAPNSTLKFIGETLTVPLDTRTAVEMTASLGFGSTDGKEILSHFGICYQPVGGAIEIGNIVQPEFAMPVGQSIVQTVAGVMEVPSSGDYVVGACSFNESANTTHGVGYASVLVVNVPEPT